MNYLSALLDLIYPKLCLNCGFSLIVNETIICLNCEAKLPFTNYHLDSTNPMIKALWGRVNIEFACAYLFFNKAGITQKLLHHLKYKNAQEIGSHFGFMFGKHIQYADFIKTVDFIVPVPLHKKKLKLRGYNQSYLICLGLSKALNIPIIDDLVRISYSDTQTKRSRMARWLNVSEKFKMNNPSRYNGKNILLVDDVFTTGATIEACCQAFKDIENSKVGVVTLGLAVI
jgi:ComF family protein